MKSCSSSKKLIIIYITINLQFVPDLWKLGLQYFVPNHPNMYIYFDIMTPKGLKTLQAMKKIEREGQEKKDKRVEEKRGRHSF